MKWLLGSRYMRRVARQRWRDHGMPRLGLIRIIPWYRVCVRMRGRHVRGIRRLSWRGWAHSMGHVQWELL